MLTGHYTYSDVDGDLEGGSTYCWLRDGATITGAVGTTYLLVSADSGHSIQFEVTARALTGVSPGSPVLSNSLIAGPPPAILNGSGNSTTVALNLTTEGTADWVHWGDASLNWKAGVTAQLSTYTKVGTGTVTAYNNDPRTLNWTDGNPTASSSNNRDGLYIDGIGQGFSFTAPADGTLRTLVVHVGGYSSDGTLTALLSDGSAPSFSDTTATAGGQYDRNYTLIYSAGSVGQTLTVTWKMTSGGGNVTLSAAGLQ